MTAMGRPTRARLSDRDRPRAGMLGHLAAGAGLGAMLYLATAFMLETGLEGGLPYIALSALVGGLVHLTRFRGALWGVTALLALFFTIAVYTPLIYGPAERLVREDSLLPADAIVCLSSAGTNEGRLDREGTERYLTALRLAQQGYADTIVRTRLPQDYAPVDADVEWLRSGLAPRVSIETVGPVSSTWDEAQRVLDLVRERGWREPIILVTSPMHTARAAAVFEKSGVRVLSVPAQSRQYSRVPPHRPDDRRYMLGRWIYETCAWQYYRAKGRL